MESCNHLNLGHQNICVINIRYINLALFLVITSITHNLQHYTLAHDTPTTDPRYTIVLKTHDEQTTKAT